MRKNRKVHRKIPDLDVLFLFFKHFIDYNDEINFPKLKFSNPVLFNTNLLEIILSIN